MTEKYRLEDLNSDWKLSTLYMAFLVPKSQQEAIKLIYAIRTVKGKKAPKINRPVGWISETREELTDMGFLIKTDTKLKGSVFKANIEPIIQSLILAKTEDSTDPVVLEGVRNVLESFWFRDFFSYDNINSPITYKNEQVYEPYQKIIKPNSSGDRLEILGLRNRMFQLISEIGYYSHNIRWFYKRVNQMPRHHDEDPIFDELINTKNFDDLLAKHNQDVPPNFVDIYRSCIEGCHMSTMVSLYPERMFKKLLNQHAALFMPSQVSILLRSAPCNTSNKPIDLGYLQRRLIDTWYAEKEKLRILNKPKVV